MVTEKKFRLSRRTIYRDYIKHMSDTMGEKIYLTYIRDFDKGIEEKYTYKDMHLLSNRLTNGLFNLGLKKGDGIALMEINSPEYLLTVFSAFKAGMHSVMVNIALRGDGLKYILDHSDASAIIVHWSLYQVFIDIKDQVSKIKYIIVDLNEAPDNFTLLDDAYSFLSR